MCGNINEIVVHLEILTSAAAPYVNFQSRAEPPQRIFFAFDKDHVGLNHFSSYSSTT